MPAATPQVVIDARPRGPRGPLAAEVVLGRPVLDHLLAQATAVDPSGGPVAVHARAEEHPLLAGLVADREASPFRLVTGPPPAGAAVLRADRLYDARRLRRALRRGRDPEAAALWRLDRPSALAAAEDELKRRLSYQPLGRYWAFPLAERIAAALESSPVRPNALTLAAGSLMLAGSALAAFGGTGLPTRAATALAFALALVLDTADGRLARLQGTGTAFGRWLDQVLDELADLALHAAVAWSCFAASRQPSWLLLGMLYAAGKYLFVVQSLHGDLLEAEPQAASPPGAGATPGAQSRPRAASLARRLADAAGHADLRWHLWIVLAALGRLDLALLAYAAYFPLRALAGGVRKAVAHA